MASSLLIKDREYKVSKIERLECNELDTFIRYQETKKVWYKTKEEKYDIKDEYFIDDWDKPNKEQIINYLNDCINRGGIVVGVYDMEELIGFANLEDKLFGENDLYIEMPFMHISRPHRGQGIGSKLFEKCCDYARQKGAKKIYIGAHPSVEAQSFYKSLGVTYAREINEEIYNREPLDMQMEYKL